VNSKKSVANAISVKDLHSSPSELFFVILEEFETHGIDWLKSMHEDCALIDPINYSYQGRAKRLRPLLLMGLISDLGGDYRLGMSSALAIELFHASSLVHDDLPALDNDAERRGRPSCHIKFGEATAILTGDALICMAQQAALDSKLAPRINLEICNLLAQAFVSVCEGQHLDLRQDQGQKALIAIHTKKTASLFQAGCEIAAVVTEK